MADPNIPPLRCYGYSHRREHGCVTGSGFVGTEFPDVTEPTDPLDPENQRYVATPDGWELEDKVYKHEQTVPEYTWNVQHNLGKEFPTISIRDGDNREVQAAVDWPACTRNYLKIDFAIPSVGYVYVK